MTCLFGACTADRGTGRRFIVGSVTVYGVAAPAPAGHSPMALYLSIFNSGNDSDTLVSARSEAADTVNFHRMEPGLAMTPIAAIPVPAGDTVHLHPGGLHIMLSGIRRPIVQGDMLPVALRFARAGNLAITAPVVAYADLEHRLEHSR